MSATRGIPCARVWGQRAARRGSAAAAHAGAPIAPPSVPSSSTVARRAERVRGGRTRRGCSRRCIVERCATDDVARGWGRGGAGHGGARTAGRADTHDEPDGLCDAIAAAARLLLARHGRGRRETGGVLLQRVQPVQGGPPALHRRRPGAALTRSRTRTSSRRWMPTAGSASPSLRASRASRWAAAPPSPSPPSSRPRADAPAAVPVDGPRGD